MATPLLKTKLYIPPTRPELVPRPRLVEQLQAGFHRKLTLVCAPPGFGKTTLLSECIASCRSHRQIAWVSLDQGDNDPIRFWSYVIAALQTLEPEVGQASLAMLRSGSVTRAGAPAPASPSPGATLPIEMLLTGLINDISMLPRHSEPHGGCHYILVLDDMHLIAESQIHEGFTFLLSNLPPHLHIIVSTRADPPWPLARLRARGELTELRAPDLRFTTEEATSFLNEAMGLDLSSEDIAALEARTEGWITGLQMAALAVRPRVESAIPGVTPSDNFRLPRPSTTGEPGRGPTTGRLSRLVQAFTGSHRFVLDYLVEEVLEQQKPEIRSFLLKTSILERLTAPLCDALIGRTPALDEGDEGTKMEDEQPVPSGDAHLASSSQRILETLEAANLFLVPLDDERRWYRYHHLFADLLRSRLEQIQSGAASDLHRRASKWYADQGLIAEAVSHALAGGDIEQVAHLVEGNALLMVAHGELSTLMGWLNALPEELGRSRPWLSLARAWVLVFAGQFQAAEPLLHNAEQALEPTDDGTVPGDEGTRRQLGHLKAIRSYIAFLNHAWFRAIDLALDALLHLPRQDLMARGYVTSLLGVLYRSVGDLQAAARTTAEAITIGKEAGDSHVTMLALGDLAALQTLRGQFGQALATARELLQLAESYVSRGGRRLPPAGRALVRISRILYGWNDLDEALRHAREGVELCKLWGWADFSAVGNVHLARALWATGDTEGGWNALRESRRIAASISAQYEAGVAAQEAYWHLKAGDLATASRWAEGYMAVTENELELELFFEYLTLARILVALREKQPDHLDKAVALLLRLRDMNEATGATLQIIQTLAVQALALQARGDDEKALVTLERALRLAEPENLIRTFVDEGPPMADLLRKLRARSVLPIYVDNLLAALEAEMTGRTAPGIRSVAPSSPVAGRPPILLEPLTERELEVLRLLNTSLTSVEIADQLYISVHTVRSHMKNIYGKLGAHSRLEAVAWAEELQLL